MTTLKEVNEAIRTSQTLVNRFAREADRAMNKGDTALMETRVADHEEESSRLAHYERLRDKMLEAAAAERDEPRDHNDAEGVQTMRDFS